MALFLSQALHYVTFRENYADSLHDKDGGGTALPFFASPVNPKAYAWLHRKSLTDPLVPGKVRRSMTVQQFEADQGSDSALAGTIFRKQHEASSLELYFDLFFVTNLAVFTDIHAYIDAQSVASYIGFFSMLWTTWFHISIYDVRFYTDCILSRFFEILCFGVMTSFVGLAPLYETISGGGGMTRTFKGIALVLMGLRFLLILQYGIVLYFVHGFQKTLIPLALTMCVYLAAGVAFLVTYLVDSDAELDSSQSATHYFIYVLYFNGISHENKDNDWGSIRQQIWAVLHYFLHVAILLTVEGQTALIIWNACRTSCMWFMEKFPSVKKPAAGYGSSAAFISGVNASINQAASRFHYYDLADYYDQDSDLRKLKNITAPHYVQYFIFVNFQAEGPKEIEETSDAALKVDLYNESFQVIFEYFYIGAGGFLIMLAIMYLFGSLHLRKDEWVSVAIRLAIRTGLPFVSIIGFTEKTGDTTSFRFQEPNWLVPIVTFAFLGVLFFDNISKVVFNETRRHRRRRNAASTLADIEAGRWEKSESNGKTKTQWQNAKRAQFENEIEHSRTMSDDSDATLGESHSHADNSGKRGYATVVQNDEENEHGHEREHQEDQRGDNDNGT